MAAPGTSARHRRQGTPVRSVGRTAVAGVLVLATASLGLGALAATQSASAYAPNGTIYCSSATRTSYIHFPWTDMSSFTVSPATPAPGSTVTVRWTSARGPAFPTPFEVPAGTLQVQAVVTLSGAMTGTVVATTAPGSYPASATTSTDRQGAVDATTRFTAGPETGTVGYAVSEIVLKTPFDSYDAYCSGTASSGDASDPGSFPAADDPTVADGLLAGYAPDFQRPTQPWALWANGFGDGRASGTATTVATAQTRTTSPVATTDPTTGPTTDPVPTAVTSTASPVPTEPAGTVNEAGTCPAAVAPSSSAAQVAAPSGSGVYAGWASPSALAAFGRWRGCPAAFAADFLDRSSWSTMLDTRTLLARWRAAGTPLTIGVPMLTDDPSTTIDAGAAGNYDGYFRALARNLVAGGYANASLRVGWEMNSGDAFRWTSGNDPGAWVTYYKRIVDAMRSAPGQSFTFDWNINLGSTSARPDATYPGDAYVDYVGVDIYDWKWNDRSVTDSARWSWMLTQPYGLNWVASFAAGHGKRITVPEWGLAATPDDNGGGGGDDPYFVTSMLDWIQSHDVAYESYFNDTSHVISDGRYPDAAAAYRAGLRS